MKFAFVFPGQGSQSVGMLNAFADNPVVRATLEEASTALGQDIGKLIAEGPAEELNLTTNTQPVMLTAAVAVYRAWLDAGGPAPALVAGHSLGEYSALVAAGVIPFAEAVPLVRFRAQAMQEAVPVGEGGMAAILGLSDDDVRAARRGCGGRRWRGRGRQFQCPVAGGDRRQQGRRGKGLRDRQGEGRQARAAAAGVGAVPLVAAQAGIGSPARPHGWPVVLGAGHSAGQQRRRGIVNDPAQIKDALVRQAAARCAGSSACRRWPPRASPT
jgi:[acyl-carrier-protein] S-malonyltransferase